MRAAESKAGVQSAQGMENASQDELSGSESLEGLAHRRCVPKVCAARAARARRTVV
jgi:hypothetical protein